MTIPRHVKEADLAVSTVPGMNTAKSHDHSADKDDGVKTARVKVHWMPIFFEGQGLHG